MIIPGGVHVLVSELLVAFGAVASGFVAASSYRRRRRLSFATCWKCHYDLRGCRDVIRCIECGADLSSNRWRALQVSYNYLLGLSAASCFLMAMVIVAAILLSANNFNWNAIKPSSWLVEELVYNDESVIAASLDEMHERIKGNGLPAHTMKQMIAAILWRQKNPQLPFLYEDGMMIDHLFDYGHMSDREYSQYCKEAIRIHLFAVDGYEGDDEMRHFDGITISLRVQELRGTWDPSVLTVSPVIDRYYVDDNYRQHFDDGVSIYDGFVVQFPIDKREVELLISDNALITVRLSLRFTLKTLDRTIGEWIESVVMPVHVN